MCNFTFSNIICFIILYEILTIVPSYCYHVTLTSNGPIIKGGIITFTAKVFNDNKEIVNGSYKYTWNDNAIPGHFHEVESSIGFDTWKVYYNDSIYPQGPYIAQVVVCRYILSLYCYPFGSNRIEFYLTETLNGDLNLIQDKKILENGYVSNLEAVNHSVSIKQTDAEFIKNATTVSTHWFIDCTYYGITNNLQFLHNYTKAEEQHLVEALVVADFTPLPPPTTTPAPTTTTHKPNITTPTTTIKPTTTTKSSKNVTTTTLKPNNIITKIPNIDKNYDNVVKSIKKRDVNLNENSGIQVIVNGSLVPYNGTFPYVCNSKSEVTDLHKTFGYFQKSLKVKTPVSKINITGNNWLQHGELLTLSVKCQASPTLKYCVEFQRGLYNVTGNESCSFYLDLENCEFTIQRYFTESTEYTIIIIITNELGKKVTPVTVTVYKVKKQAQLSVIVVPVAFSLVAVVLIVFGVAYYFQNRSRFVVEVADFNFGKNFSDMEYKTFKERLRDSVSNAFNKNPSPSSEVPVWPPGRKYGSMAD